MRCFRLNKSLLYTFQSISTLDLSPFVSREMAAMVIIETCYCLTPSEKVEMEYSIVSC